MLTTRLRCLLLLLPITGAAHAEQVELRDYLEALRASGQTIIYSDNVVRPGLLVDMPDGLTAPSLDALRSALSQAGLNVVTGPQGALLIVPPDDGPGLAVRGTVRGSDGRIVAGALIRSTGGRSVRSDPDGSFELTDLSAADVTLNISAAGYRSIDGMAVDASRRPVDVVLEPQAPAIDTIVVSASQYRLPFGDDAASAQIIGEAQLRSLPLLAGETVRAVAHLPATSGAGINARPHVRGGDVDETLFLVDGVRIYDPFHLRDFQSPASVLNADAISSVEFYSGGYPASFGDRMSGVFAVTLRESDVPRRTELDVSTLNTSIVHAGNQGDYDWLVSARRSNLDLLLSQLNTDYGTPRFGELLLHGGWQGGEATKLGVNLLISRDNIALNSANGENAGANYDNSYGWLRWQQAFGAALSADTRVSHTEIATRRDGTNDRPGVQFGTVLDKRRYTVSAITQDWRWRRSDAQQYYAGIDLRAVDANYDYSASLTIEPPFDALSTAPVRGAVNTNLSPDGQQYAAWLGGRWLLGPWFVDAGLRWDYQNYTISGSDRQISPRLAVGIDLGERTTLRASWGRFHQAQGVNELQVADGLTQFFAAQRAEHRIVSLEHRFVAPYVLRLEAYSKINRSLRPRFENLFDPLVLLPELHFDRIRIDRDSARHRGIEALLRYRGDDAPLSWWLSYAWSESEERTAAGTFDTGWSQPHALKAGVHWQRDAWDLTLVGTVHSGWPYTELALDPGSANPQLIAGPRNARRNATFHALDLRVSRAFNVRRGVLAAYLEVNNLYNQKNRCCVEYALNSDENGARVLAADEDGWLPFLPTLGINWQF